MAPEYLTLINLRKVMFMKKFKQTLVIIVLVVSCMSAPFPGRAAELDDVTMTAILNFAWTLASPEGTAFLAANPYTWQILVDNVAPFLSAFAPLGRKLALTRPPTLHPPVTAPRPAAYTIPNSYSQVISFGDSMSDNGNVMKVTSDLIGWGIPMAPNYNGRFCNGLVIVEQMSNFLNRPLLNYAFAGAESSYKGLLPVYSMQIGVLKQVDDFLSSLGYFKSADSRALYVIWTGPDDYYHGQNMYNSSVAYSVSSNVNYAMNKLYARGARNFLVPLMPDLSLTPAALGHEESQSGYITAARNRSNELAVAMTAMLKSFARIHPLAKVHTHDALTFSRNAYAQAVSEGKNVTVPCYGPHITPVPACDDPENYLFWDGNHPTDWAALDAGEAFANAAVATALPYW